MNVIKCNNGHFYDSDKYPTQCPHCANGVEPYIEEKLDIEKIYTDAYVGGKKGQKLRDKQAKILEKENKKNQKKALKQAKIVAREAKKNKNEEVTMQLTASDAEETVLLSGNADQTVLLSGNADQTVMLDSSSEKKE